MHFYSAAGRRLALRALVACAPVLLAGTASASAQDYAPAKPRRQFVTVSIDWMSTQPLHFASHPLEDLVGREVAEAQREAYDYRTRDGEVQIDLLEWRKRNRGFSAAVYPLGLSIGTTLGIRGSIEELPIVRIDFEGTGAPPPYELTGARAYDIGAGVFVADRSAGWGLGSMAFVVGGFGRIKADDGREGSRTFAEGGGGLSVGPFGVQLAVKFAWNRLEEPVEHQFWTVPITVRGTVSF